MSDPTHDISDLDLPGGLERKLRGYGLESLETLATWNAREVLSIPGVGKKALAAVEQAMSEHGFLLAEDPVMPYVCVRHAAPAWDTRLSSFMLCDECLNEFRPAFKDAAPPFDEVLFEGYCQNCNAEFKSIHMAQWFLCGTCERVARSIGRGIAAEAYVLNEFRRVMDGTGLSIEQVDRPVLRPFNAPDTGATIDFLLRRGTEVLAGVELKTGRNHLGGWAPVGAKIGQFQLDHGDCDAITAVAERERILVYLMHAQVIDRAAPPTTRFEP
ncbi:MAG: hypothetical protein IH818_12260, partial [Acidobacteria bacterium]|nr:hypothetical protein [Acidobacteriota bacterium]